MEKKNFQAEEEEIDNWFEEQKEKLTNSYLKKIHVLNLGEIAEDKKKAKAKKKKSKDEKKDYNTLSKEYEAEFLAGMSKVREEYRRRYERHVTKRENFKENEKRKKIIFTPVNAVLKPVWNAIKIVLIGIKNGIMFSFGWIVKSIKKTFSNLTYNIGNYYTFHLRSGVDPFLRPIRKFFRILFKPISNMITLLKAKLKKKISETSKKIAKLIDKTISISKVVIGLLNAKYKKYSEFLRGKIKIVKESVKKVLSPVFSPIIEKLKTMFKKEEE